MLDSNICIAMIRSQPPRLLRRLQSKAVGQVGTSSIVLAELSYGVAKSKRAAMNLQALGEFVEALEVAPFDAAAAQCYGRLRATLSGSGMPIGPLDTLIAAHAIALDVTLVTNNVREFRRVRDLRVEDWLG